MSRDSSKYDLAEGHARSSNQPKLGERFNCKQDCTMLLMKSFIILSKSFDKMFRNMT